MGADDIGSGVELQPSPASREEQLQFLVDSLPMLTCFVDRDETFQFVNATYAQWFVDPPGKVLGRTVRDVVDDDAYAMLGPDLRRALAGQQMSAECELPAPGGQRRSVWINYIPYRDSAGAVQGCYALIEDITARKQAEAAMARRERDFRTIFENSASGKARADVRSGRFDHVNRCFCELTGYAEQELLGLTYDDLAHRDDLRAYHRFVAQALAGQADRWTTETRFIRRDGQAVWVLVSMAVLRDSEGVPAHTLATIQDISQFKQVEDALRESEQRFRTLADNIAQFAWMADGSGRITWFNKRWFDYTGTTLKEMEGWGWMKVHHPDHVERVVERYRRCVETGEPWEDTFPIRARDASYRWFLSRAKPIYDEHGGVTRWFGTNTDITERLEAEHALQESDRRKDRFLATLGHELRNPLAGIIGGVQVLEAMGCESAEQGETQAIIARQARLMQRLIDDLLDVSRIVRGKIKLQPGRLDLAELVREVVQDHRRECEQRQLDLQVELPRGAVPCTGDRERLRQVCANLLHNARKFTDPGGRVEICLAVDQRRRVAQFRVSDSGVGMDQTTLRRIFQPFEQADMSLDRGRGGLGLGLALVKGLVDLHRGRVIASSDGLGQGSVFTIEIPLANAAHDAGRTRSPAASAASTGTYDVLVIDDRRDASYAVVKFLEQQGHRVRTAIDGPTGVVAAQSAPPDVVVCDIGLPGFDGYEVAQRLRADRRFDDTMLIALTGYGQLQDRQRSRQAGFDHHLVKPVGREELLGTIAGHPRRPSSAGA